MEARASVRKTAEGIAACARAKVATDLRASAVKGSASATRGAAERLLLFSGCSEAFLSLHVNVFCIWASD